MKFSMLELTLVVGFFMPTEGSFTRDVLRKRSPPSAKDVMNEDLLAKALPLDVYKKEINVKGLYLGDSSSRRLENYANDDANAQEEEYENEDDYYVNEYNWVNFTGYSFKYAKCQPIKRFSQSAVEADEYSPMIVNDIVILRLCPSQYCSDSKTFGCNSNYIEYAIELTDYIRIMLRYEMDKSDQLCDWCDDCTGNRRTSQQYYYTWDDEGNVVTNNVEVDDYYTSLDCTNYDTYCFDSYNNTVCDNNNNNNQNAADDVTDDATGYSTDDGYSFLDFEQYLDLIECTKINGGYFIRPRCDAYSETLSMGIYYDKFCSQYAGNEVNLRDFNLGINPSYFNKFGKDSGCQDCSDTGTAPTFSAKSNLCNRLEIEAAGCSSKASSAMKNYTDASDTEHCSFIESVQYGAYDADGQLYMESHGSLRRVTGSQKFLLTLSILVASGLAVYACYLHHAITNLLIKSLSNTDLLPPSKYRRRMSNKSKGRQRRGSRSPSNMSKVPKRGI